MKKITKYIANNGKEFESEEDALIHEEAIYLQQDLEYKLGIEVSFSKAEVLLREIVADPQNFLDFFLLACERRQVVIALKERLRDRLGKDQETEEMPF